MYPELIFNTGRSSILGTRSTPRQITTVDCFEGMENQEEVWAEIGKIVARYPLMECDRAAIAVMAWLKQQKIPGKILKLRTQRKNEMFILT